MRMPRKPNTDAGDGIECGDDMVDVHRLKTPATCTGGFWTAPPASTTWCSTGGSASDERIKIRLVNEMDSDHIPSRAPTMAPARTG